MLKLCPPFYLLLSIVERIAIRKIFRTYFIIESIEYILINLQWQTINGKIVENAFLMTSSQVRLINSKSKE